MKESIRGSVKIRISDNEMTAYIDYKKSEVVFEWSDRAIKNLLKSAGVKKGFKVFQFSRILKKINTSTEDCTYEIASGLEPSSGVRACYHFTEKVMPKTLEETYNNLNDSLSKPDVFTVLEGKVLGTEPDKISYDILNSYYVDKHETIATIDLESKNTPGFTVTGKDLDPKEDESDKIFCVSRDIKIKENRLVTSGSGFLRIGKNWVDIIPFKGHVIDIQPSDDYAEYFISFTPGSVDAPAPEYDDILNNFVNIDYPLDHLLDEKTLIPFLKKAVKAEKTVKISLTKKKKAKMEIEVNPTKTQASLILEKGAGPGQKLSLKAIGALIRESKIKGMNLDLLKKRILEFYKSKNLKLDYTILEGKPATRGEARRLKYQKEFVPVDKIEGLISRISQDQQAFYPSFKSFDKDDITSGIIVAKGFEFALLTEQIPGDDGTDIYGKKIKGLVGNDPIIETFENISIKQNKYISEIDGILDIGDVDGVTYLRVREHKDMYVDVILSADAMSASLTFYKSEGSGEDASIDFINEQIEESGVVKGIHEEVIKESFENFENGELVSEIVFAKGQIPTDKKSSQLKYFNGNGQNRFSYEIEKGSSIAQIFPSKESAEDGYDVLGTIMESSGVISLDLKIGDYISEEKQEDESIILKADINGELKVDDNSVAIVDKKVLPGDVNVKTGSIKTLCSLVVKGSVYSSLYVVSGGNIKIMGTVQGALISADKNIIIAQGVKGEDKAVLRAKEKIDVKFIEKANMMAVDDIHIRKAALHTKIICNGKILLDKNGSKIVGGETYTRKGLSVDEIGSPASGKTLISFGQDYLVADKIKVFEGDIDNIQQDLLKIDQILHKPTGHHNSDKINHLRKQKVFLMKKLEKKNMKLFLLREKFEEHSPSEITIRKKIYPGAIFESHGRKLEIIDEQSKCKIKFNPNTGQIEQT
ncbi:MAG: FapA family protein [Spirochaetaceae bacterium]